MTGARDVLRLADYRHYLLGQTLSALGDSLMPVALAFAVLDQGGDAGAVGLVVLAARGPAIAVVLLGGALGDRADRRTVMVATDLVRCAVQAATAALLLSGTAPLWSLALLQAVAGTASALFAPSAAGLVRALVPVPLLVTAGAVQSTSRSVVSLVGLALSWMLVATVGSGWAFALDALTFAGSAVLLARLPALLPPAPADSPLWRAAAEGVHAALSRRWLWTSVVYVAGLNLVGVCPFLVLGPVVAEAELGGAGAWAAVGLGYAAGGTAGSALVLRHAPDRPLRTAFTGALALAPFLLLLAQAAPVPLLVAAAVAAGGQAAVFNVLHTSVLQTHVPAHLVSRVASVNLLGSLSAVPLGLALTGPLAELTSPRAVLTSAAACAVAGTLAVLAVREVRHLQSATATSSGGRLLVQSSPAVARNDESRGPHPTRAGPV